MSVCIVDCETVPLDLSDTQCEYLTRNCDGLEECHAALAGASLSPWFGRIAAIGMLNPNTMAGAVTTQGGMLSSAIDWGWDERERTEAEILAEFWTCVKNYKKVVTFNGRGFDLPFLLIRSAALGVTPSRFDLMGPRYSAWPHCDLMDQLAFYGATKKVSLAMMCETFGIDNPKLACDGSKVAELFKARKHREIAEYNLADLRATAKLWEIWRTRL